jgi:hypothetical protein
MSVRGAYKRSPKLKGPGIPKEESVGEQTFLLHCRANKISVIDGLVMVMEYQFCERGWRFDFAWPWLKVAVEVEGGTMFGKSRHSRGAGFENDCSKYNRASIDGWIVLRYSTRMVISGIAINEVVEVLTASRKGEK